MKIDKTGAVIPVADVSTVPSFGAAADGDADRNVSKQLMYVHHMISVRIAKNKTNIMLLLLLDR